MKASARFASAIERSLIIDHRSPEYQQAIGLIKGRWDAGESIDALAVLADFPELAEDKSFVLEVAYEEFCRKSQAGELAPLGAFYNRYPAYRSSFARLIEIHHLMVERSELLLPDDVWPEPGDLYLGFELLRELGRGAFSCVYFAREPELGNRPVALKISNGNIDEGQTLGKLQHPNIVPVLYPPQDPESLQTVLCMPFQGQVTLLDLEEELPQSRTVDAAAMAAIVAAHEATDVPELTETPARAKPWDPAASFDETVLALAIQLCDALAHAHGKSIFHHDLKPTNILITPNLQALLFDFNLSVDAAVAGRRPGGTLAYMAPEQITAVVLDRRDGPRPGAQADLYALGVVLYELLTGSLPLDVSAPGLPTPQAAVELLELQRRGAPPINCAGREVDEKLAAIVHSCLSFDPADRPQSAEELGARLQQRQARLQRAKRARRHTRQLVGAIVLLTAMTGLVYGGFSALRPPLEVRELDAGQTALAEEHYREAIAHFDVVLATDPSSIAALFGRARAHARLEEFTLAIADYDKISEVRQEATALAGKGYCLARMDAYSAAIGFLRKALERGAVSAALFNDLGYCLFQDRHYDEAKGAFDEAIRLDSEFQPAYCNRVMLAVARYRPDNGASLLGAIADAERALDIGPISTQLLTQTAYVCARLAESDDRWVPKAIEYLDRAVSYGAQAKALAMSPSFARFADRADFRSILAKPQGSPEKSRCDRLVELP